MFANGAKETIDCHSTLDISLVYLYAKVCTE